MTSDVNNYIVCVISDMDQRSDANSTRGSRCVQQDLRLITHSAVNHCPGG